MQRPTYLQTWLLGLIGLTAMAWSTTNTNDAVEYGDAGNKLLDGLMYLVYAPYFLEILDNFSSKQHQEPHLNRATTRVFLTIYTLVLLLLGTILNARGIIILGIINLGITITLLILMGQLEVSKKNIRNCGIAVLLVIFLSPILSDFATAVVVTRAQKGEISNMEMLDQTLTAFQNKKELEEYRELILDLTNQGEYNETYIPNPFLARFIYTKFLDNMLSLKQICSMQYALALWDVTLDKILALMPTPLIKTLNLNLDKNNLKYSFGDIMYYLETGKGLGGYRVGSTIAHGIGLMGYLVFIAVIPLFILLFISLQSFVIIGNKINLSLLLNLQIMMVFNFGVIDSLVGIIGALLRTLPQSAVIFALIYKAIQIITSLNNKQRLLLHSK